MELDSFVFRKQDANTMADVSESCHGSDADIPRSNVSNFVVMLMLSVPQQVCAGSRN